MQKHKQKEDESPDSCQACHQIWSVSKRMSAPTNAGSGAWAAPCPLGLLFGRNLRCLAEEEKKTKVLIGGENALFKNTSASKELKGLL